LPEVHTRCRYQAVTKGLFWGRLAVAGLALAMVVGCAQTELIVHTAKRVTQATEPPPEARSTYKVGNPYQIEGVWYSPAIDYAYQETGIASWYGSKFHGRPTANGEIYDMNDLTAAHRTLPLPSFVRVTNLENGRTMTLRVNDRGPFAHGRILDASRRAAQLLGFERQGTARVRVTILADESRALAARLQGKKTVAAISTPIKVDRLPQPDVSVERLPPPAGASAAPAAPQTVNGLRVAVPAPPPRPRGGETAPKLGEVTFGAATPTTMFVQAGAFSQFHNANQVRARLAGVGPVKVSQILIEGRDLFRVRVGPLSSVEEADRILDRVIRTGYSDARIVVD
jgi:rare lipoprotein A